MKWDWQHAAIMFGAPFLTAFLDYEVNSASPFSKTTLEHALLASCLVLVAMAKKSFVTGAQQ